MNEPDRKDPYDMIADNLFLTYPQEVDMLVREKIITQERANELFNGLKA
jgi:hypothetical protein